MDARITQDGLEVVANRRGASRQLGHHPQKHALATTRWAGGGFSEKTCLNKRIERDDKLEQRSSCSSGRLYPWFGSRTVPEGWAMHPAVATFRRFPRVGGWR